jgi:hypothetical protein
VRGTYTSKVNDTDLSITRVTGRGDAGPKRPLGDTGLLWSPVIEGGIGYGTFHNHFDNGPLDGNTSTVTSLAVFLGRGVRFTACYAGRELTSSCLSTAKSRS